MPRDLAMPSMITASRDGGEDADMPVSTDRTSRASIDVSFPGLAYATCQITSARAE